MISLIVCSMVSLSTFQDSASPPSQPSALTASSAAPAMDTSNDEPSVRRVGGDMEVQFTLDRGVYRCGDSAITTPLPDGYPAPTPPGAIEIKNYPSLRRAEINGRMNPDLGMWAGFYPLFSHIKKRDIAMTSPVEMDYTDWSKDDAGEPLAPGEWTMSFLYRSPNLGPVGSDGKVEVVDTEPMTVLSIGIRGPYGLAVTREGIRKLTAWLDGQQEWIRAGDVRTLHYNGPDVPSVDKWSEVQLPIQRADKMKEAGDGSLSR